MTTRQNSLQVLIIPSQAEENYSERAEKETKTKLVRVYVLSFDKSHHFYTLHIFIYCFGVS